MNKYLCKYVTNRAPSGIVGHMSIDIYYNIVQSGTFAHARIL